MTASAGSARLPTMTGCTNSTATWRASETSPVASSRPPRAKRSAISPHSRASRSASAANHEALASRRRSTASASIRPAPSRASSQSRKASTPSPVRALTCMRGTPGCTASRLCRKRSMSKSRCGSRSILLITTSSQVRNISGYLSGLSSPSVTDGDHHPRVLADAELRRADEVADVLDHEQVDVGERQRGQRAADHVGVEMALAAEARVGVELRHRHVQAREPVGVVGALDVALEHARAHVAQVAQHPLEQRRLAGARARSSGSPRSRRDDRSRRGSRARSCCWRPGRPRRP